MKKTYLKITPLFLVALISFNSYSQGTGPEKKTGQIAFNCQSKKDTSKFLTIGVTFTEQIVVSPPPVEMQYIYLNDKLVEKSLFGATTISFEKEFKTYVLNRASGVLEVKTKLLPTAPEYFNCAPLK